MDNKRVPEDDDTAISVEMEDLLATESAVWQSSRENSGLRQRNVKSTTVLDEVRDNLMPSDNIALSDGRSCADAVERLRPLRAHVSHPDDRRLFTFGLTSIL